MVNFLDQLKEKKILSQKDIDNFQSYIDKKYGALEDDKKHTILKNSIAYVVNRDLERLEIDDMENFVLSLVEETLLKGKEDLCAHKIFEKAISERPASDNFLKNLTSWVNEKIETPLDTAILQSHMPSKSAYIENTPLEADIALPTSTVFSKKSFSWLLLSVLSVLGLYSIFFIQKSPNLPDQIPIEEEEVFVNETAVPAYVLKKYHMPNKNFPRYLYYRDINEERLKAYLISRNSLLQKEPYFTHLLATAKEFNINSLLLFAIAGHEQAFVPIDHPSSDIIVNNPFNVFGSWQRYNTSLKESSEIAARTIFNSLSDLPPLLDPFFWMNRRYAEDPHWWKGVREIFWLLEGDC